MTKFKNEHEVELSEPPVKSVVKETSNDGVPADKTNGEVSNKELLNGLIGAGKQLANDPTINEENSPADDEVNESGERTELTEELAEDEEVETPEVKIEASDGNDDAPTQAPELGAELEKYKGFRAELAVVETMAEMKTIENKAAAMAEYARRNKIGYEEQNSWGRFRLEIENAKGKWLNKNYPKSVKANQRKPSGSTEQPDDLPTKMPVSKTESSHARMVSDNPLLVKKVMDAIEKGGKKVITPNAIFTGIKKEKNPKQHTAKKKPDEQPKTKSPYAPVLSEKQIQRAIKKAKEDVIYKQEYLMKVNDEIAKVHGKLLVSPAKTAIEKVAYAEVEAKMNQLNRTKTVYKNEIIELLKTLGYYLVYDVKYSTKMSGYDGKITL